MKTTIVAMLLAILAALLVGLCIGSFPSFAAYGIGIAVGGALAEISRAAGDENNR